MRKDITISTGPSTRMIGRTGRILLALAAGAVASVCFAADPDQSKVPQPAGDGWQILGESSTVALASAPVTSAPATHGPVVPLAASAPVSATHSALSEPGTLPTPAATEAPSTSTEVKAVVLPGASSADPTGTLSFTITPQSVNLRNALDRWLQSQGWQLAWKIDDDLPVEFNASFTGDFRSILAQVMQATDHMRTPARVCKHTNNVIRVIARAANCKD